MKSDVRPEVFAVLGENWSLPPDVRLGQILSCLGVLGEVHIGHGLGYIEVDELIAVTNRHRVELLSRQQELSF